jgi:hypothetical protein
LLLIALTVVVVVVVVVMEVPHLIDQALAAASPRSTSNAPSDSIEPEGIEESEHSNINSNGDGGG